MRRARAFAALRRVYFRPECRTCLVCGAPLAYSHPVWRKHIIGLSEVLWVGSLGYRCRTAACGRRVYRSAEAEGLSLKGATYGMDVLVTVGRLRTVEHCTRTEIHAELGQRGVIISARHVQGLYEAYFALLGCTAGQQVEAVRRQIEQNGGLVLSLDGIQPERGNDALWVVREVLTGVVLTAATVTSASAKRLQELLHPVMALGFPVLGVISDGQHSIRLAVQAELPTVPHQCCQFHYLRDVALPFSNADRKLRTDVRKQIRGILAVEEKVAGQDDPEAEVVRGYCTAIRSVLLDDGLPPLEPGGLRAYENLERIYASLQRCLAIRPAPPIMTLTHIATRHHTYGAEYATLKQQHAWLLGLTRVIDPEKYPGVAPHDAVAQAKENMCSLVATVAQAAVTQPEHELFAESLRKYTRGFGDTLFTCFLHPEIPRTNNDLERFLRHAKSAHRRTTGRASWDSYIMRYGELAVYAVDLPSDVLIKWFSQVPTDRYRQERKRWIASQEPRRQRRRYRKAPEAFLNRLEQLWQISAPSKPP